MLTMTVPLLQPLLWRNQRNLNSDCPRHQLPGIVPVPFQPPEVDTGNSQRTVVQKWIDLLDRFPDFRGGIDSVETPSRKQYLPEHLTFLILPFVEPYNLYAPLGQRLLNLTFSIDGGRSLGVNDSGTHVHTALPEWEHVFHYLTSVA